MADHRKFFRPRRLVLGALFLLAGSILPALAEDAGLKNGAASLAAGKYDNAVRQLSSTINADNAAPAEAAKALYLRGIAYRKLGQPARAISDLGAAIFLGLPDDDRVKALVNRGLAYQAAGLSSQGDAEIAQARKAGGSGAVDQLIAEGGGTPEGAASIAAFSTSVTPEAQGYGSRAEPAAAPPASQAPTQTANASGQWTTTANAETGGESASSGNRVSRWFGSLTGSSSSGATGRARKHAGREPRRHQRRQRQPPPSPQPRRAQDGARRRRGATPWWRAVRVQRRIRDGALRRRRATPWWQAMQAQARAGGAAGSRRPPRPTKPRRQRPLLRPEAEAASKYNSPPAARKAMRKRYGSRCRAPMPRLAGKSPDIEKVDIGNFGTFYSLKVGPFPDKAESLKVCNALKRSGVDCSLVSPEAQ